MGRFWIMLETPTMPTQENPVREAEQRILEAQQSKSSSLDLMGLNLNAIPESVYELVNLETLDLDNNQISTIPENLSRLANLWILDLDNNQISTIPESLSQL